jgi:3-phenylpropionate/trans-cinnamate dioxygenase ferredoxin reductase component
MPDYRYLVVGAGMTAHNACRGMREHDADGSIGVVGAEAFPPYKRPPLSKALWKGGDEESIWLGTGELGVEIHSERRVTSLQLDARTATDDRGESHGYERLLLATGGRPKRVPAWGDDVVYFRTLTDYRALRAQAGEGKRFTVIGGGFIGSEVAAALSMSGSAVTLVVPEDGIGARLFPAALSAFVTDYYREQGVEVLAGETVASVDGTRVTTGSGRVLEADGVVAGLGIEPATELAADAGLAVDDGVLVDELGRAGERDDVFAAGDVARFPVALLGGTTRVEHEDNANSHGRAVGANMAGAGEPYAHLPFFYSDLFELGYEAVGEVDSRHQTIAQWKEPNRAGVLCYVDGSSRPRGFLLWDVWGRVDDATAMIAAGEPVTPATLRTLLD